MKRKLMSKNYVKIFRIYTMNIKPHFKAAEEFHDFTKKYIFSFGCFFKYRNIIFIVKVKRLQSYYLNNKIQLMGEYEYHFCNIIYLIWALVIEHFLHFVSCTRIMQQHVDTKKCPSFHNYT